MPAINFQDPFTFIIITLALILIFGYFIGAQSNKARRQQLLQWLEPLLRAVGGTPSLQVIHRTTFRVHLHRPPLPMRHLTTTIILISREFFPRWLWETLNHLTDVLVFHITLATPPILELEADQPASPFGQAGLKQIASLGWQEEAINGNYILLYPRESAVFRPGHILSNAHKMGFPIYRLAIRRDAPHILLSLPVPALTVENNQRLKKLLIGLPKWASKPSYE